MAGVNRITGMWMTESWPHTVQSIGVIVSTHVGSRVQRRDFGCDDDTLVDRPLTEAEVLNHFTKLALALYRWEPRFRLTRVVIVQGTVLGKLVLGLTGVHYPRGHLGDFSKSVEKVFEAAS